MEKVLSEPTLLSSAQLRSAIKGEVILPDDASYDRAQAPVASRRRERGR
jgi:hypothetical protein